MNTPDLVTFLKQQNVNASFTDKLKITYRPYICPFDELLALVKPVDIVADIGCGSGQLALLMAEFAKPSKIVGVEISQTLIDNARTLLSRYTSIPHQFEVYDGGTFPTILQNATKYFMVDVLHHIPRHLQVSFLKNVYSLMPTGSQLIIKDINGSSPFVLFNKLHDLIFAREIGNELALFKTVAILQETGFTIERTNTKLLYVYPHYTVVATK
jgi:cyclopropane fatty-acyl-phospholipid synthase-like methyltransferase